MLLSDGRTGRILAWSLLWLGAAPAWALLPPLSGRSVGEVIALLRAEGLAIFYATDVVDGALRVADEPRATDPARVLAEVLAPHGLATRAGPQGAVIIVPAARTRLPLSVADAAEPESPIAAPRPSLEEIVVAASRYELTRAPGGSYALITGSDIEYLPDLGEDALRAVHRLPGTASNGFSARASIRGGELDETLVRFDKLRLYSPFHLKSFQSVFSTVDPRIVERMDVYTGGFPASYGDRMSGVIDVATLPAPEEPQHEIALSFFNASVLSSGSFADGRGQWLASARRSNLDLLYNAFSDLPERPRYVDTFAKVSYEISERLSITGNALYFADDVTLSDDLDIEERALAQDRDRYYWLRLDHRLNPRLSGTTLLAHANFDSDRYGSTSKAGVGTGQLGDRRSFEIDTVQSDWSWRPEGRLLVQFGGLAQRLRGRYDYRDEVELELLFDLPGAAADPLRERSVQVAPRGDQQALYASLRYRLTPRFTADLGIRWDRQTLAPANTATVAPRLGLSYRLGERSTLRASWGRFYQSQAINELQVADGVDWFYPPQRADHSVLGFEHEFERGLELRFEVYDKAMQALRPRYENLLNSLTLLPELKPDRFRIAPDSARARGAEVLVTQRLESGINWWVGYSRSRVRDVIDGAEIYRAWDQTHTVTAGINLDTTKWNVGVGLSYRSGWPTTPVHLVDGGLVPIVEPGARNSERVDFYRSVDIRLTRRFAFDASTLAVFFEVSNVLGRDNPCCTEYELEADAGGAFELTRLHYLPFVPSLGIVWEF